MGLTYRVASAALLILTIVLIKRHLDHVQDNSHVRPIWQFSSPSSEYVPETSVVPETFMAKEEEKSGRNNKNDNNNARVNGDQAAALAPAAAPAEGREGRGGIGARPAQAGRRPNDRPKAQPNAITKGKGNRKVLEKKPAYQTTPITVPNDRVIVMAKMSYEDTSWVGEELANWRNYIYTVDNIYASRHTPINKGKESLAYLQYIVEHYHSLPTTMVFIHSHKDGWPQAWHTDTVTYSNVDSVRNLQIDTVQRNGYVNLRCQETPGCPDEIHPFRETPRQPSEEVYAQAWQELFNNTNVPEVVGVPCCSQFAVSRNQVLRRPKADYERYYNWVLNTELSDDVSGRVLEYSWHIIFGMDPVYCPDMFQCYKDVYGSSYFW